jgi:hypothetical protein
MHPTQHSTIRPRILRTHDLITKGVSRDMADAFVKTAASNLQALGHSAAARGPKLHLAPVKPNMQELLRRASQQAKPFTPRHLSPHTAA